MSFFFGNLDVRAGTDITIENLAICPGRKRERGSPFPNWSFLIFAYTFGRSNWSKGEHKIELLEYFPLPDCADEWHEWMGGRDRMRWTGRLGWTFGLAGIGK